MNELKSKIIQWFKENKEKKLGDIIDICLGVVPEFNEIWESFMNNFRELEEEGKIELIEDKDSWLPQTESAKYRLKM